MDFFSSINDSIHVFSTFLRQLLFIVLTWFALISWPICQKRVETIDDICNDDDARLIPGIEKWLYNMPPPPTLDITHVVNIYVYENEYKYVQ